jgi:two-component sensor histidine kinase
MSVLDYLFGAASFVPHGFCLAWRPDLVALHAVSDALIAMAYFAIPTAIVKFIRHRDDLEPVHVRIAGLFVAFILACGVTHLMGLVTLWYPAYGADGLIKLATAVVSVATAVVLWPLVPRLIALPSHADLRAANRKLTEEVDAHERTLAILRETQRDLEQRVEERTRDLAAATRRFEMTLRGSAITVFQQDADLRYLWIFNPPQEYPVSRFIGRDDHQVLPEVTAAQVVPVKRRVLETGVGETAVAPFPMSDGTHWFEVRIEPVFDEPDGRQIASVAVDITEKKEYERHMRMVMRELTHRSKNLLTIVQSLARQSAKTADGIEQFAESFGARLAALAQSHDLLVNSAWRGASMADLVAAQLGHLTDARERQIDVAGPALHLQPNAAQNLGLALHELATNSIKYGALSVDSGRIEIRWSAIDEGDRRIVRLTWTESGGPPVVEPTRSGFGRIMLERLVPRALGGDAVLDYRSSGLVWTLTLSPAALEQDDRVFNDRAVGIRNIGGVAEASHAGR